MNVFLEWLIVAALMLLSTTLSTFAHADLARRYYWWRQQSGALVYALGTVAINAAVAVWAMHAIFGQ